MRHKLLLLYSWFVRIFLFPWPDVPIIMRFRGWLYGLGMKKCGKDFQITHDAILKELENIFIGNYVYIADMTILMGSGEIHIGDNVQIGPHCTLVSSDHKFINGIFSKHQGEKGTIIIEQGSWIAANCVVAKGAVLPERSVLAACSFLSKHMESPRSMYGGVPAKFIKDLS